MIVNDKIGVVLSGGGFKGLAQLGVLHFMQELRIPVHAISGTSVGALIGAFMAQGYTPYQILDYARKERIFSYTYLSLRNGGGLFNTNLLDRIIKKYIPHNSFEDLKIPFYTTVTDLTNGRELTFTKGDLALAVKASCSCPLIFQPVLYKDTYLCDGGLVNNFPLDPIVSTCNMVIGVNVNPINKVEGSMNYQKLIGRIIRITSSQLPPEAKAKCTLYLEPDGINNYTMFETQRIEELFEVGYMAAKKCREDFLNIKAMAGAWTGGQNPG